MLRVCLCLQRKGEVCEHTRKKQLKTFRNTAFGSFSTDRDTQENNTKFRAECVQLSSLMHRLLYVYYYYCCYVCCCEELR
jgi:hypothetical protein